MTARRLFGINKHANVLTRMDRLLLTGLYQPPMWYDAVRRCPPTLLYSEPHPGAIVFPEDRLYPRLYDRLPQLRDEALHITSVHEPSIGRRLAERWATEIDKDKSKDEEAAWERVMADTRMQQLIASYDKRVADTQHTPITAGNIQRHMQAKLEQMGLLRQRITSSSSSSSSSSSPPSFTAPLHSRAEVETALTLNDTAQRGNTSVVPRTVLDQPAELTVEREGLLFDPSTRSWLVPSMSATHQLRFVTATPNPHLNHLYHSHAQFTPKPASAPSAPSAVVAPLTPNTTSDDVMEWLLSKAKQHDTATLRDWVAYVLRMQILVMRRLVLAEWKPYTNCIDATLWRQARVVLRCATVDALEGVDMTGKSAAEGTEGATGAEVVGVRDGLPLVYHESQAVMDREEQRKWAMLLSFVDDAMARHQFDSAELEERAPSLKSVWTDHARAGRQRRREKKRFYAGRAAAEAEAEAEAELQ